MQGFSNVEQHEPSLAGSLLFDPRDRATIDNPIPILKRLQALEPVYWCEPLRSWVITGYDDAKFVLRNDTFSADRMSPFFSALAPERQSKIEKLIRYLSTWVAFKDPPDHTRLRKAMKLVFNPEMVEQQRDMVKATVETLVGRLEGKKEFDFIAEYAFPLPAMVIMRLLGLPERDMDAVREWSANMQLFIGSATTSTEKYSVAEAGAVAMADYFMCAIKERERRPRSDLLTELMALREAEEALTDDEVVGTAMLFLFGGHETTTNLIGNGVRALLNHPDQLCRLKESPSLVESAIEEILRYDGPTGASVRVVGSTQTLHGKVLEAGQRVFVMINAANHDARIFDQPEKFDISRSPNLHLTFNYGPHFCMGAPLARLEGQIAISGVLNRLPRLALASRHYEYMDTMIMRGVRKMPVTNA
jgi:cytochrome P450